MKCLAICHRCKSEFETEVGPGSYKFDVDESDRLILREVSTCGGCRMILRKLGSYE